MKPISRRDMLGQTGILGAAIASALPLAQAIGDPASQTGPKARLKVVVTGGHPGDPEYGCGGTIARYSALGHEVVLLYLNRGEWTDKPGFDPGPVRVAEARKACVILQARPVFAGQIDGQAIVDRAHYDEFHDRLHAERPDVVVLLNGLFLFESIVWELCCARDIDVVTYERAFVPETLVFSRHVPAGVYDFSDKYDRDRHALSGWRCFSPR